MAMETQIIQLEDGLRIEAEITSSRVSTVTDGVKKTVESIKPMLMRVVQPVADAWSELNSALVVERAEVEVGFGIETSGNFFVASSKGNVNLKIKLIVSRKEPNKV